ncbi:MAG: hypothetical protein AB7F75_06575 [Planctomycetota bacterium]
MSLSRAFPLMVLCLAVAPLPAQEQPAAQGPGQEEKLKAGLDKKLTSPFVTRAPWILEFDKAKARSKELGKPILVYATRSYVLCPRSIGVESKVLDTEAFAAFAKNLPLFLHVTSLVPGRKDDALMKETYGITITPTFFVLDAEGTPIMKHEGPLTQEALADTYALATNLPQLKTKAQAGDAQAVLDLEILEGIQKNATAKNMASRQETAAKFAAHFSGGREPSVKMLRSTFFSMVLQHAMTRKLPDLAEKVLPKYEAECLSDGNPVLLKGLEQLKANIAKMRGAPNPGQPEPAAPK